MHFYHYTKLGFLRDILSNGGSFSPTYGRYNLEDDDAELGFYFTDLPPETPNSVLFQKIFGHHPSKSDNHQRLQAYLRVNLDGRSIEQSTREHVFLLSVSAAELDLEILEFGQRVGWQSGGSPERQPWNYKEYWDVFKKKGHTGVYDGQECLILHGLKIRRKTAGN